MVSNKDLNIRNSIPAQIIGETSIAQSIGERKQHNLEKEK